MKFWMLRHTTYMFIAISIIGEIAAIRDLLAGKGAINLLWMALNVFSCWIWVRSSFEYFVWKKEKQEKEILNQPKEK